MLPAKQAPQEEGEEAEEQRSPSRVLDASPRGEEDALDTLRRIGALIEHRTSPPKAAAAQAAAGGGEGGEEDATAAATAGKTRRRRKGGCLCGARPVDEFGP